MNTDPTQPTDRLSPVHVEGNLLAATGWDLKPGDLVERYIADDGHVSLRHHA